MPSGEFDTNGDREITTSELREAMMKLLGHQVGHRDIEEIIWAVDLNETLEQLSSHWFLEGMQKGTATLEDSLQFLIRLNKLFSYNPAIV